MKSRTVSERNSLALIAGLLALASQGASSEDAAAAMPEPVVIKVTAPRPEPTVASPRIEADARETIESLDRQLVEELERHLEAIRPPRIELAIAEVPPRG